MVELETPKSLELEQESPGRQEAVIPQATRQSKVDPLLVAIFGMASIMAALILGTALFWDSVPVLVEAAWYIPLISAFISLITLLVGYLALGRYQVLRDPVSFWVGTGFCIYGIGHIFYAFSWPNLIPDGSILGNLPSTSAWIGLVNLSLLAIFLLAAVLFPWPGRLNLPGSQWIGVVLACLASATVLYSLLVLFEESLPMLVDANGVFTPLQQTWVGILLVVLVVASVYSVLYYQRSGDRLVGLIALPLITLVFVSMMVVMGGKRYDLWWYLQRVALVAGHLSVLIGLLSEYVKLLKRESEGRRMLEAILANIPVGLAVTGGPPHFPIDRVSRHGLEMTWRNGKGVTGPTSQADQENLKILLPDPQAAPPAPEQMPLYRASQLGEDVRNMELVMETLDGRKIPVLVNAAPIHDVQGNIVAAISTWLDITDRKRVEETLQASVALYRAIARSIPRGGIFVVDKDLRYIIAEGTITEKFGISKDMIEGHTVAEIFDEEIAARMEARFRRALEGETISYETEHNGRIYWTQHAVMDDPQGHAIVVTMDVTERKQAEKALSESEQRFRAIINQATAGIVRADIDGRSLFVNQAFCEMLGYSEADLTGESLWKFTHPEDLEESRRLFDRLKENGKPFHLEERMICRDGSILWVNISASPILDELDRPRSAVFIVVDITERKEAEEALQQLNLELERRVETRTAELQAANWALFESRRRLQVLSQRLVEIQEEERRAIARELHDRVGQTLTALNLNLTIVNDQLASRVELPLTERLSDSIRLVTEMIAIVRDVMSDLRPVVLDEYGLEAALQAYLTKFEARYGIHVDFLKPGQPMPRLGAGLEMTILRITQEALLNTARHAHADLVSLSLQCEQGAVRLDIEDNGVGFPAWQETSRSHGHGLMLMLERAEAVGGTLKISSIPAKGTRIEALLPYGQNDSDKSEEERRE